MNLRTIIATVLFGMWLSTAAPSAAQTPAPKVVVVHSGLERLAVRIAAELSSIGYEAEILDLPPPIYHETLEQIARDHFADAVMRASPAGNSVQVWVPQKNNPDVTVIQEVVVPTDNEQAEALITFKSVELLRAGFLVPMEKPAPEPKPVAPPPPPPAPPPPTNDVQTHASPRLALSMQPAAVFGFGNLPPALNIGLSLYLRLASRIGLDLSGLIPTFPMTVRVEGGTVDVSAGLITAGIRINALSQKHRWTPSLSLLAGPLILKGRGRAETGYKGFTQTPISAVINGVFTMSFSVNSVFALKTDAACGIALPEPVFRINGIPSISFGSPMVTVLFGVEVRLL